MIVCAVMAGLFSGVASAKENTFVNAGEAAFGANGENPKTFVDSGETAGEKVARGAEIGGIYLGSVALLTSPVWGKIIYNQNKYGAITKDGKFWNINDNLSVLSKQDPFLIELNNWREQNGIIDPKSYDTNLGRGYNGEAFLNNKNKRVLKTFAENIKKADIEREVRLFNEMQLELGNENLASARLVKDSSSKFYMETPFIDGKNPTKIEYENLETELYKKGFNIWDLRSTGNVKISEGKPVIVDANERIKFTRNPSLKSIANIKKNINNGKLSEGDIEVLKGNYENSHAINTFNRARSGLIQKEMANKANGVSLENSNNPAENIQKANLADSGDITKGAIDNAGNITTENKAADAKNEVEKEDPDLAKELEEGAEGAE